MMKSSKKASYLQTNSSKKKSQKKTQKKTQKKSQKRLIDCCIVYFKIK